MAFARLRGSNRIIPAYAGSTSTATGPARRERDHPRIRGEHVQMNRAIADGSGSSPHTRGALDEAGFHHVVGGIIPAYAGSTSLARGGFGRPADHPRIRGEHDTPLTNVTPFTGSSPHTRGAQ